MQLIHLTKNDADFHPGLQELFKGNNCDVKWKIFGHIISPGDVQ